MWLAISLIGGGLFMMAVSWHGFFRENRDPDLPRYARGLNEANFIVGAIAVAVGAMALAVFLAIAAL